MLGAVVAGQTHLPDDSLDLQIPSPTVSVRFPRETEAMGYLRDCLIQLQGPPSPKSIEQTGRLELQLRVDAAV